MIRHILFYNHNALNLDSSEWKIRLWYDQNPYLDYASIVFNGFRFIELPIIFFVK